MSSVCTLRRADGQNTGSVLLQIHDDVLLFHCRLAVQHTLEPPAGGESQMLTNPLWRVINDDCDPAVCAEPVFGQANQRMRFMNGAAFQELSGHELI